MSRERDRLRSSVAILVAEWLNISVIPREEITTLCRDNGLELISVRITCNDVIICSVLSLYRLLGINCSSREFWLNFLA